MSASRYKSFTKNFFSLLSGQTISLLINFISITLVARYLGVEDFGVFSYTIALVTILSKFIDVGLSPITFRETSKSENKFQFLNTALSIRLILFIIVFIIFNLAARILSFTDTEVILSDILFVNILISAKFQNFRELLDIPFKVSLSSHLSMIAIIMDNSLFLILILLIPYWKIDILFIVIAYVISNIPGFIFLVYELRVKCNFRLRFSLYNWRWLIQESLPLLIYVIIISFFQQMDLLILKNLDSEYATGIYSAALRLTLPLMIIPSAIISTVFPTLVKNVVDDRKQNITINKFIYKILFFTAFVITSIISMKTKFIIILIFGSSYENAYIPMIYLLITQIFLFYNLFTVNILTAYNKQKKIIKYAAIIMIINLVLDFLLVPVYSFNGAAVAKLIAVSAGTLILTLIVSKEGLNFNFFKIKTLIWILVIPALLYGLNFLSWPLYFISALLVVIFISLKLNYFDDEEILLIFRLINREKWGAKILKI